MSQIIDDKVVIMEFDNSKFEKNVSQSMSTLDKLKEKLEFKGAEKGLENIQDASDNLDFSSINNGVDKLTDRFSVFGTFAGKVIENLADKFSSFAEGALSSLTQMSSFANIGSGWNAYETALLSQQSIMSAVSSKINSATQTYYTQEDVSAIVEKLRWYSDETSYSLEQMTNALASFTASGVDASEAQTMVMGIANACAAAGVGASKAEYAFTGFAKAIGSGAVTLNTWNQQLKTSGLTNSEAFRQSCLDAAVAVGTLVEAVDESNDTWYTANGEDYFNTANITDRLTEDAWLTSDAITLALSEYSNLVDTIYSMTDGGLENVLDSSVLEDFTAAMKEQGKTLKDLGLDEEFTTTSEAISKLTEAYETLGVTVPKSLKAFANAQEAVTFTQAIESVTTAVQSKWSKSFELIFGNYSQASKTWTTLANDLYDIFVAGSDDRNELLETVFSESGLTDFTSYLNYLGITLDDFQKIFSEYESGKEKGTILDNLITQYGSFEKALQSGELQDDLTNFFNDLSNGAMDSTSAVTEVSDKLSYIQNLYDKIWNGDYGNGQDRVDALTALGIDYETMQGIINTMASNDNRAGYTLLAEDIEYLTEEQLKAIGITTEQAEALSELKKQADEAGISVEELIAGLTRKSGRELLAESIHNLLQAVSNLKTIIGTAWENVFGTNTANKLYDIVYGFNQLTASILSLTTESSPLMTALSNSLEVLFSIAHVLISTFEQLFSSGFTIFNDLLGIFVNNIDTTNGTIGSMVSSFASWYSTVQPLSKAMTLLGNALKTVFNGMISLWNSFKETSIGIALKNVIEGISQAFSTLMDGLEQGSITIEDIFSPVIIVFDVLKTAVSGVIEVFKYLFDQFLNTSIGQSIKSKWSDFIGFVSNIGDKIKELTQGLKDGSLTITDILDKLKDKIASFFKSTTTGIQDNIYYYGIQPIVDFFKSSKLFDLDKSLRNLVQDAYSNGKDILGGIIDFILNINWDNVSVTLGKIVATGTLLLGVGGIIKILISVFSLCKTLLGALDIVESLGDFVSAVSSFMYNTGKAIKKFGTSALLTSLTGTLLALVAVIGAIYMLTTIEDTDKLWQAVEAVSAILGILAVIAIASAFAKGTTYTKIKYVGDFSKNAAAMIKQMAFALIEIAVALKIVGSMDENKIQASALTIGLILAEIAAIIAVFAWLSKKRVDTKTVGKLSNAITSIATALLIIAAALLIISFIKWEDIGKGLFAITTVLIILGIFLAVLGAMQKSSIVASKSSVLALVGLAGSLLIFALAIKVFASMRADTYLKGLLRIIPIIILVLASLTTLSLFEKDIVVSAATILALAGSLLIMAIAIGLLGTMDVGVLAKGSIAAIAIMSAILIMVGVYQAMTSGIATTDLKSSAGVALIIVALSVALLAISASLILLSLVDQDRLRFAASVLGVMMVVFAILIAACALLVKAGAENIFSSAGRSILSMLPFLLLIAEIVAALLIVAQYDQEVVRQAAESICMLMVVVTAAMIAIGVAAKAAEGVSIAGFAKLEVIIAATIVIIGAFGLLLSYIPEEFRNRILDGLNFLALLGEKIGYCLTSFLGGMISGLTSGLQDAANNIKAFIDTLSEPIQTLAELGADGELANKVGTFVDSVSKFFSIDFTTGASKWKTYGSNYITGISNLSKFLFGDGSNSGLTDIFINLSDRLTKSSFNSEAVSAVADMASSMAELYDALPSSSILDSIFGHQMTLTEFASELNSYVDCLVGANGTDGILTKVKDITEDSVSGAVSASESLASIYNSFPKGSGVAQWFTGTTDLTTVGNQLSNFFTYLCGGQLYDTDGKVVGAYISEGALSKASSISGDSVTGAKNAAEALGAIYDAFPSGGFLSDLEGSNTNLSTVGGQLSTFFAYMVGGKTSDGSVIDENYSIMHYISEVSSAMSLINSNSVDFSQIFSLVENMGKMYDAFPTGGALKTLEGNEVNLGEVGKQLRSFFTQIYGLFDDCPFSNLNDSDYDAIDKLLEHVSGLMYKVNEIITTNTGNISSDVGVYSVVKKYAESIVSGFVAGFDYERLELSVQGTLDTIAGKLNSETALSEGKLYGTKLVNGLYDGLTSAFYIDKIDNQVLTLGNKLMSIDKNEVCSENKTIGEYTLKGLLNGLQSEYYINKLNNQITTISNMIPSGIKKLLGIESPSKVTEELGMYSVAGLVNGLSENSESVEKESENLGYVLADSLKKSIELASSTDELTPTITPVLDLSELNSGLSSMNSMISQNGGLAVKASSSFDTGNSLQSGSDNTNGNAVYSFTQNNYSPKALSAIDIYRDTKTLYAFSKRTLGRN